MFKKFTGKNSQSTLFKFLKSYLSFLYYISPYIGCHTLTQFWISTCCDEKLIRNQIPDIKISVVLLCRSLYMQFSPISLIQLKCYNFRLTCMQREASFSTLQFSELGIVETVKMSQAGAHMHIKQ